MRMIATSILLCLAVLAGCKQVADYSETPTTILCMDYLDEWGSMSFTHDSRMQALADRLDDPENVCNPL